MGNERNISLSVALIAHNEGPILGDALWSVCWADQLVVVDAGSTDNTAVTAKAYGAEVYTEPNRTNLNENKNIAIDHCRGEWILVLDADEVIPYDLAGAIRRTIADKVPENGLLIPRKNFVLGRWTRRGSQYPDYQLRLFRRGRGRFPAQHVHERLKVQGKIGKLDIPFEHHPYRDLDTLIEKTAVTWNLKPSICSKTASAQLFRDWRVRWF